MLCEGYFNTDKNKVKLDYSLIHTHYKTELVKSIKHKLSQYNIILQERSCRALWRVFFTTCPFSNANHIEWLLWDPSTIVC